MRFFDTIQWYLGNILDYVYQMLPCMCAALAFFFWLQPWRKRRLAEKGLRSGQTREVLLLVFVLFCTGLGALTLFPSGFWRWELWVGVVKGHVRLNEVFGYLLPKDRLVNLRPFQEVLRAFRSRWSMFLLLGNIGIFTPIGFFAGLLWRRPRWWKGLLAGFWGSFFIEVSQFFVGGRSSDIDDVLLNTIGAVLGYGIYWIFAKIWPRLGEIGKVQEVSYGFYDGN